MNKRIYDLAAQIGITTKELIDFLNSKGIETKNHLSIIDEGDLEEYRQKVSRLS